MVLLLPLLFLPSWDLAQLPGLGTFVVTLPSDSSRHPDASGRDSFSLWLVSDSLSPLCGLRQVI